MADTTIAMQMDISTSVQQGESYSNVSIDHTDGFKCVTADGLVKVLENGTNGFLIQHWSGTTWVTVWEVKSDTGKSIAYSADHSKKVEMGGDGGFTTWSSIDGGTTWVQTGGLNAQGQSLAAMLMNLNAPNDYAIIGDTADGSSYSKGFALYHNKSGTFTQIFSVSYFLNMLTKIQGDNPLFSVNFSPVGISLNASEGTNSCNILVTPSSIQLRKNNVDVASW
jgi:hypothetical protein